MATVELRNVTKSFGKKTPVEDLNLTLEDGKFTVLVGPSGCGKTTTLRMIAGLEATTTGHILIDGADVTKLAPRDRDVSMVFQNYALYPHLSVLDNIAFPILARGGARGDAIERAREAAGLLGLDEMLDRRPGQLSGGQQQRVAIGRAIVRKPRVFLFDEPLSNLDARLRVEMRSEILRLQRQLGVTAIYVTHDQEEAMTMSDTMVVMEGGKIAQQGGPSELYAQPVDRFVAGFVGSPQINFIDGEFVDGRFISNWPIELRLDGDVVNSELASRTTAIGVRPELLIVEPATQPTGVVVELIEALGPRSIVSLTNDRGDRLIAVVDAELAARLTERDPAVVRIAGTGVHLFDDDQRRIATT